MNICNDCNRSFAECGYLMYHCRHCQGKQWCMNCGKKYVKEFMHLHHYLGRSIEIEEIFYCPLRCKSRTVTLSFFEAT